MDLYNRATPPVLDHDITLNRRVDYFLVVIQATGHVIQARLACPHFQRLSLCSCYSSFSLTGPELRVLSHQDHETTARSAPPLRSCSLCSSACVQFRGCRILRAICIHKLRLTLLPFLKILRSWSPGCLDCSRMSWKSRIGLCFNQIFIAALNKRFINRSGRNAMNLEIAKA